MAENGAEGVGGDVVDLGVEGEYKAPAMVSVEELKKKDAEDEALQRMKKELLPDAKPIEPDNPKNVLVRKLNLMVEGRPDVVMDLSEAASLEKKVFVLKEGTSYRLRIDFHVQREIVSGLRYIHKVHRAGIPVDTDTYMVGSYAPKNDVHSFTTPSDEAPSGMLHRGTYKIKSLFTDDDKNEWLKWEWNLEIKKDWD
jgi:hypothetical protein